MGGGMESVAMPGAVDVHSHVVPDVLYRAALRSDSVHGMDLAMSPDRATLMWRADGSSGSMTWMSAFSEVRRRVDDMDRDGIRVQVLSINPAMYGYAGDSSRAVAWARTINEAIASMAAQVPDRFVSLAHLPMQDPAAAARELERAVLDLGAVGAGIGTNVAGDNLDAQRLRPVFEAAEALDAMIFIHPADDRFPPAGHPYFLQNLIGHPVETTVALGSLIFGGVFDRYPRLRVCLAHGGGYGCLAMGRFDHGHRTVPASGGMRLSPSEYRSQIFVDSLTHGYPGLRLLVEQLGASQCVLGTDYPTPMSQSDPVNWLDGVPWLDGRTKRAVLSGNARALLGSRSPKSLKKGHLGS